MTLRSVFGRPDGTPVPAEGDENVLELRIHGVNNTPPEGMLEVAAEDAEKVRGDSLGSFWTPSAAALAHGRSVPATHHDHIPADVRREAYSWGPMARRSGALPGGVLPGVVAAVSRAGWMLLVPLGLANVAYWSRHLVGPGQYGRGARSVRLFALGLSLLLVTSVSAVALDVVATQCVGPDGVLCPALPSWLTWLGGFSWSERLVLLSVAPVAALLVLNWLATGSRVRYEHVTSAPVATAATSPRHGRASGGPVPPVLARPGLWSRWVLARSMGNLHVAAGLALVVITLAWSQVYGGVEACRTPAGFVQEPACLLARGGALEQNPVFAGLLGAALLVGLAATVLVTTARVEVMPRAPGRTTSAASAVVLGAAVVVFLAMAAALWTVGEAESEADGLVGLVVIPGAIVAVLLVIALAGLTWRRGRLGWVWIGLAVGLAVALASAARVGGSAAEGSPALAVAVVVVVLLVLASAVPYRRPRAPGAPLREQAWAGSGPGVFLLLSLGMAMIMSGLLVVVVGDWLNGAIPATCLVLDPVAQAAEAACQAPATVAGQEPATAVALTVPASYAEFGVATLAVVALVLLVVLAVVALALARAWWSNPQRVPDAPAGAPDAVALARAADQEVPEPAGIPAVLQRRTDLLSSLVGARHAAALLHRGEPVVGLVAGGVAVAVAGSLFVAVDSQSTGWLLPREVTSAGLWTMAFLWTAVLVKVVAAQGETGRPIGLIWDLMCFLPRSAHPFGPPCYAERAVPEIAARMDAWLRGDDLPTPASRRSRADQRAVEARRVVLSAHSLGAVLAVAALFTRDTSGERGPDRVGRVGLLTYGSQLRTYFGRMFPELLGPEVLGTAGAGRAVVLGRDPWRREVAQPPAVPVPGLREPTDTLVRRLGGRGGVVPREPAWVSLWRRTDPLGFPVASYAANTLDRGAEEIDATAFVASVAGHSGYPRTGAYRRGLREVLTRLDRV